MRSGSSTILTVILNSSQSSRGRLPLQRSQVTSSVPPISNVSRKNPVCFSSKRRTLALQYFKNRTSKTARPMFVFYSKSRLDFSYLHSRLAARLKLPVTVAMAICLLNFGTNLRLPSRWWKSPTS